MKISAKGAIAKGSTEKRSATIEVPLAENFDDAVAQYGKEVMYEKFIDSVIISIQSAMRSGIAAGKTDEQIQAALANYKPGVKMSLGFGGGAPTKEKMLDAVKNFSPEDKAAFIAELKKMMGK